MLYHRFMVYRVRSTTRIRGMRYRRRHPLLSLTTLWVLGFCATAIYASYATLDGWGSPGSFLADRNEGGVAWEFSASIPPENDPAFRPANSSAPENRVNASVEQWRQWPPIGQQEPPWDSPQSATLDNDFGSMRRELGLDPSSPGAPEKRPTEALDGATPEVPAGSAEAAPASTVAPAQEEAKSTPERNTPEKNTAEERVPESRWLEATVSAGDSLSGLFSRMGLPPNLPLLIALGGGEGELLEKIAPGQLLRVQVGADGAFQKLILERSALSSLQAIATDEGGFETSLVEKPVETRRSRVSGVISDSLYNSAKRNGLSDAQVVKLVEIFGWDVDFALEIQPGDSFNVLFEEQYIDGKKYRNGDLLAAEFINGGKRYRAVRYETPDGEVNYYTENGSSMRKAFLRNPVDFRRISSRFNPERYHPISGKKRPHRGVDYAAAKGTPIRAAGDGKVIFRGVKGGYGKTLILQHGEHHTTLYAHLSKYRSKVRQGDRVKQGEVIGYVGATGLATGAHLHYEFRVDGVHRNPLTVKLAEARPIDEKYREDFLAKTSPLIAKLETRSATRLARAE